MLCPPLAAQAQNDLSGSNSFSYQEQKQESHSITDLQEALYLSYNGALSPEWRASLAGNLLWQKSSELENPALRPFLSGYLSNEPLWLNATTSFLQDRNYEAGTATLETSNSAMSMGLRPPNLPSVTLNYGLALGEDDLSPKKTDFERTTRSIQLGYRGEGFDVFYLHSESEDVSRLPAVASMTLFQMPKYVAVDGTGAVYVVDEGAAQVLKFNSSGGLIQMWGTLGAGPGQFITPTGIAVDLAGNVYVADAFSARVQKFDGNGNFLLQWGVPGIGPGQFSNPTGLAADATGIYVADTNNNRIQKFDTGGAFLLTWGTTGAANGQFLGPQGVASNGTNVFVADTNNHRIQTFDTSGAFVSSWGTFGSGNGFFSSPRGIAVEAGGFVYVADSGNDRVQRFTTLGGYVSQWGSTGTGDGDFVNPIGIAADASGNLFVVDSDNDRVQRFLASGAFITGWGNTTTPAALESRREHRLDSVGGSFSYSLGAALTFSGNFGVTRTLAEDNLLAVDAETTSLWTAPSVTMRLLRDVSLAYNFYIQEDSADIGSVDTERRNLTHSTALTLVPYADVACVLGYHESALNEASAPETSSRGPSATVSMKPLRFANVNMSANQTVSEVEGQDPTVSYVLSMVTNVTIFRQNVTSLGYTHTITNDRATDTEGTIDTATADLYLLPWRRLSVSSRNTYSVSATDAATSFETVAWSTSAAVSWLLQEGTSLSTGLTHGVSNPDTGPRTSRWTGVSSASYQWQGHTASVFYSSTRDISDSQSIGATTRLVLSQTTTAGFYAQWTFGTDNDGDRMLRADVTVAF
ncbi:MAG: hypothetical protein HYY16_01215 [Planctomycetes bacterium]|nr:hypothetical protein [Planctomycetota bacterium]